ncbi:serine/threonine-protein kinase [Nostoc sp. FACHB-110]|uniref:serine/threonine protein kinase n=1 Tax=Nostoc sp. FACHB-110 TaxID=2692834 RepID=UPI0016848F38|nr:serine/threonine-protein kinase [Nostoc sp. FACHB-110]MBD2436517.1 serine/threonine protein kinase [Nostoc sp. FACHB-110]
MLETGYVLVQRYQLKEKIGQSNSRQTWLALDQEKQPQEKVIVKLLTLTPQMQWDECKLFEREAQVLKSLNHPRIPKYRDYFRLEHLPDSRFPWFGLVQSYIPGVSLQQLLNQGKRFTTEQVEKIAVEVLSILIYLHELNPPILHRDIKPSNLIWGKDERVYLVDFGAVQEQAALEGATFTVVGTYGYVPMEQFALRAVAASDIYALGATLIHLLTGIEPADLPHLDYRLQFFERVNVDLGFVNWISKMTEPNVSQRFSTARQALTALEQKNTLSPPITSHKPMGSKIRVNKSANTLEIKIPRRGRKALKNMYLLGLASGFFSYIFPNFFTISQSIITLDFDTTIVFFLLLLLIFLSIFFIVIPACGETYLYFDRDKFKIKLQLFGICYSWGQSKTAMIINVSEREVSDNSEPRGIVIETSERTLERGLAQYHTTSLSTVEREWLIQEIKDWLGLEKQSSNQNINAAEPE